MLHLIRSSYFQRTVNSASRQIAFKGSGVILTVLLFLTALPPRELGQNVPQIQTRPPAASQQDKLPKLERGTRIERALKGGETHSYEVELVAGQFAHFVVEQQGIDLVVSLIGSGDAKIAEGESASESGERWDLLFLVKATGKYRLQITSTNQGAPDGHYELRIAQLRAATQAEILPLKARAAKLEADRVDAERDKDFYAMIENRSPPSHYLELFRQAVDQYQEALKLWRQVENPREIADLLYLIGERYFSVGDRRSSLTYYAQSLEAYQGLGDNTKQIVLLDRIGEANMKLGEYERAVSLFNQELQLALAGRNPREIAIAQNSLGEVFYRLGQFEKCRNYYREALALWEAANDTRGVTRTRYNIDLVDSSQPTVSPSNTNGLELVLQSGHLGIVNAVAVSPDKRLIVTGGTDNAVRLWELGEERELRTLAHHLKTISAVKFSPDGRIVASASEDGTIKLIETDTGKLLRTLVGFGFGVWAIAFSPDGQLLAAASFESTLKLWDVPTGRELHTFVGHRLPISGIDFSPDGRMIVSGGWDATIRLWDVTLGQEVKIVGRTAGVVTSVAFTPDGKSVVSGTRMAELKVWDIATNRLLRNFVGNTGQINSIATSPDGRFVISAGGSGLGDLETGIRVWDTSTGAQLKHLGNDDGPYRAVVFSRDGSLVLTAGYRPAIQLWDVSTWRPKPFAFTSHMSEVRGAAISTNGSLIAARSRDGISLWNAATGNEVRKLSAAPSNGSSALSSDGGLVAAEDVKGVSVWNTSTERTVHKFDVDLSESSFDRPDSGESIGGLQSLAFSKNGELLAIGGKRKKPILIDTESGNQLASWVAESGDLASSSGLPHKLSCYAVAFSPDGRLVASAVEEVEVNAEVDGAPVATVLGNTVYLWETKTGVAQKTIKTGIRINALSFSPNGRWLTRGGEDQTIRVMDLSTGLQLRALFGHSGGVNFLSFSSDGRWLAAAAANEVKLWDTRNWRDRTLQGHTDTVTSVSFTDDTTRLISSSRDGSTRVWEVDSGIERAKLIALDNKDWAVVTPDGHFYASPQGMKLMHWIVGSEAIALEQLKERYYEPHLLAKVMGFDPEPLRPVSDKPIELFPLVEAKAPGPDSNKLTINLTNRGGGIGKVQVLVNDKEVTPDARPGRDFDYRAKHAALEVDLSSSSYFVGRNNNIRVIAFNSDGNLSSRSMLVNWKPSGTMTSPSPELYAIVAGISKYSSPGLNLRFAAKDADDMSRALSLGAKRLFGADKIHITLLSTSGDARAVSPTKANFENAFREAQKARPSDILIIYFAGHAITASENRDTYYFLTKDARTTDSNVLTDREVRDLTTISTDDLLKWIRQIPALKQVIILDTCAAGAAEGKLVKERNVSGDQIRAIERLKDRTGFHVLMGSAADALSYEASEYGQGLLTYALLKGMKGAALREEEYVDVQTLFQYAADQVPKLAIGIGGIQKPTIAAPSGTSFDVGRLIEDDRSAIPLEIIKPVILRPLFLNAATGEDALAVSINKELRARLRDDDYPQLEGKATASFVYIDVDEFKDGIRASGTYKVEGDRVILHLHLRRNDQVLLSLTIEDLKDDVAGLVNKIMTAIITTSHRR